MKGITGLPVQWTGDNLKRGIKQETVPEIGFKDMLKNAINEVDSLQKNAEQKTLELAMGKSDNLHDVVIATEKANMALQLTLEIRNKMVESYQEIMRMQV